MNRVDELIADRCPEGVPHIALREVLTELIVPMRDRPKTFNGDIPWCRIEDIEGSDLHGSKSGLNVSESVVREMNLKVMPPGTVIASCSASLGSYAIASRPLITNQTFIGLVCGPLLYNRFLLHLMFTKTDELRASSTKGTIAYVSRKKFEQLKVPVPPLDVQHEIVKILDDLWELEDELVAELERELEARKQQFEHYQRGLLSISNNGSEWMTLGDIGRVAMCKRIFKSETTLSGEIPFFKIGTFGGQPDAFIKSGLYEDYRARYSYPSQGDILVSAAGTIGRTVAFDGEPAYFQDSNIVWLEHDESIVLNTYLRYWYRIIKWSTGGDIIKRLYNENIRQAQIAVPSVEEQQRIVNILDELDALVAHLCEGLSAELTARQRQYEFYRDKLLTFKEMKVTA